MTHHPNFIEEYPNAMSDEMCDKLINLAGDIQSMNPQLQKSGPQNILSVGYRKDWFIFTHEMKAIALPVNRILGDCLNLYIDKYMGAFYSGRYYSYYQKLQMTPPGGGIHSWHNEHSTADAMDRIMAWMFYLNDIDEGGETEFLHQKLRIKPTKGTLVMFPASYTHSHRGNPPLSQTKYILTGWYQIAAEESPLPN